jgi:site-specific DNA-methyltransferase (adenine-specific)
MISLPTESEPVTVVEGDALEVMASLPDGSIDSVITDPPYCAGAISEAQRTRADGQGLRSENLRKFGWFVGDNMGTAGLAFLLRAVAFECRRVVKPTGSLIVFADWRMLATLQPCIESAGLRYQGLLVWDKGSMGLGNGFRNQIETALHFTFGSPEYHTADVSNLLKGKRVRSPEREHQAQKPVGILRDMARVVCPPGGVILDPFAGSGTTGIAALREDRRALLIEADPEHVETIRRRLAVPALFAGVPA